MIKRSLIFVHRWLGVALCLLFLIWFPSGIGIMYWDFPTVTAADRLERSPSLDRTTIRFSAEEAHARVGTLPQPTAVRLNTFDGRPVYRFRIGRGDTLVYADTGEEQLEVTREMIDRAAAAWTGQPVSAAAAAPVEAVDQWTVQAPLRTMRPLWKYSWPNGEQVYVAATSGEVVQYTTTASRIGAYLGPIPHWLYFTPLRQRQSQWSTLVIWTSGIGTLGATLGLVIGVWMYSPSKKYRHAGVPTAIPYRGQKRWHTVLGLIFGVGAVTWAFSGMLSMDPFPSRGGDRDRETFGERIGQALRSRMPMASFTDPRDALARLGGLDVKELELTAFDGEPVYLATLAGGETRVVPMTGEPRTGFEHHRLLKVIGEAAAVPPHISETRVVEQYDRYYLDRRRQRPLPVLLVRVDDAQNSRYYIDPRTARVVGSYSSRNWMTRWAYHGLHSLDFPWLYNYRPLWDIVVITFMVGGTALCVTSLILAWRVIGRTAARAVGRAPGPGDARLSEDLA